MFDLENIEFNDMELDGVSIKTLREVREWIDIQIIKKENEE